MGGLFKQRHHFLCTRLASSLNKSSCWALFIGQYSRWNRWVVLFWLQQPSMSPPSADLRTAVQLVSLSQIEVVQLNKYMFGNLELTGRAEGA